ncbi:MAG: hypothetical protein ACREMN_07225 [Gemmatimonadales bacterium]
MRALPVVGLVIAGAVALGACEGARPESALAPQTELLAASTTADVNAASGAVIVRFTTVTFTLIFDAERQLLAAHMPSDAFVCGGSEPLNLVDVMRVTTPSEIGQRFALQTSDAERVAIYRATSPADAGLAASINFFGFNNIFDGAKFCDFLTGPTRLAEGPVQRISTFTLASFHGRWTGRLAGVDGRAYQLTEVYQLTADIHDPNNPDTFAEPVVRILLQPIE